jgi:hypothetical protein
MPIGAERDGDRLRFAGIEFDSRTGEIWKDGSRTVVPEQLVRLLSMFVREPGSLDMGPKCFFANARSGLQVFLEAYGIALAPLKAI